MPIYLLIITDATMLCNWVLFFSLFNKRERNKQNFKKCMVAN